MTQVSFDGYTLTGPTPDGGVARLVGSDGLEGWFSKSLRRDRVGKSQQDGAWASVGNSDALTITLRGQVVYKDALSAATGRRNMLALGGRQESELTVDDALGSGTRLVETDALSVSVVRDTMVQVAFAVTACDPLLYGPQVFAQTSLAATGAGTGLTYPLAYPLDYGVPAGVTPGAITVANAGTASYFPRLRIDGPVTNPVVTLVETGDVVRFKGAIAAGQHLDINWGTPRRVTLGDNAVNMRHKVSYTGNWLAVPVGGGSISYTADDANPAALLSVWSYEGAWE